MKNQTTSIHLHTPSSPRIGEPPEVVPPGVMQVIEELCKHHKPRFVLNVVMQLENSVNDVKDSD